MPTPYSTDYDQPVDELGFTEKLPGAHQGPPTQFRSEKQVAQRNANLMKGAFGRLGAGIDLLQSYRPGGAAALTSGLFQGQANVLAGSRTQAPDLLNYTRGAQAHRARKAARRGQKMALVGGLISAVGSVAGAAVGGAPGAAIGGAPGKAIAGAAGSTQEVYGQGGGPTGNIDTGFQPIPTAQAQIASSPATGAPAGAPAQPGTALPAQLQSEAPGTPPVGAPAGGPTGGGPQPGGPGGAPGGAVDPMAVGGQGGLLAQGSVGSQAMAQQLTTDLGPTMASNVIGIAKMDLDIDGTNEEFYDVMDSGLDAMASAMFSRLSGV